MEYTVERLARLAGVSARTIRYYDTIGLLRPMTLSDSGYRLYGPAQVDRLQHILFYRELGMDLRSIAALLDSPGFDRAAALREHRTGLLRKREQLDALIDNVSKTIKANEGGNAMTDLEKFEGFKQALIDDNEQRYGREVRQRYGDRAADRANAKIKGMSPEKHAAVEALSRAVDAAIAAAFAAGDPAGTEARQACELHRQWLLHFWDHYTPQAHLALGQMYADDERFRAYYDRIAPGCAVFLRDALAAYTAQQPQG